MLVWLIIHVPALDIQMVSNSMPMLRAWQTLCPNMTIQGTFCRLATAASRSWRSQSSCPCGSNGNCEAWVSLYQAYTSAAPLFEQVSKKRQGCPTDLCQWLQSAPSHRQSCRKSWSVTQRHSPRLAQRQRSVACTGQNGHREPRGCYKGNTKVSP